MLRAPVENKVEALSQSAALRATVKLQQTRPAIHSARASSRAYAFAQGALRRARASGQPLRDLRSSGGL